MVHAIRDQWVIAVAIVAVLAIAIWLLADQWLTRRRGGR
jgi:hypothetical protein